jgi:hypothetical protein
LLANIFYFFCYSQRVNRKISNTRHIFFKFHHTIDAASRNNMIRGSTLDARAVQNVILTWYHGTNEHLPVEQLQRLLSADVEMRYPNRNEPFVGHEAFHAWYADVLSRYFDETHIVESWDIDTHVDQATAVVIVRWETRAWEPGAARSTYRAYLSRQRFKLVRREDGVVHITAKIVETFDPTTPIYGAGA